MRFDKERSSKVFDLIFEEIIIINKISLLD